VTGGAGFIGSHVVDRLVADGFDVLAVDNLSTGRSQNLRADVPLLNTDITGDGLERAFRDHRPEVVLHLAAQTSVTRSVADPRLDAQVNVVGSLNLFRLALQHGVRRLVFSSTGGALYGNPRRLPCPETAPIRPLSPYGVSKAAVEQYLPLFDWPRDFVHVTLRYGNVYGPRQDPFGEAGVIAIFTERMLKGMEVTIFGDGKQERDFVYAGDVVEANMLALQHGASDVFNIASGEATSVNDVFAHLAGLTRYEKRPVFAPKRPGEVDRIVLDVRRAARRLGWVPRTPLGKGLAQTVDSFRPGASTGEG
jgi:UDP-glucose 4-epimerase